MSAVSLLAAAAQASERPIASTPIEQQIFSPSSRDDLRGDLQPAFDQADRGELREWDVEEFLVSMHRQRSAKTK